MTVYFGQCETCGTYAPTQFVTLRQQIGALIVRFEKRVEGRLCKACIDRYFWQFTPTTALLGWWGAISFFVTPIYLATNLGTFISSRKLASVAPATTAPPPMPGAGLPHAPTPGAPGGPALAPQALRLREDRTGSIVNLTDGVTLGRSPQRAQIVIADPRISELHACVVRVGNNLVLEDAGSTNGILINGQLSSRSPLMPGMRVQFGDTQLTVLPRA